MLPARLAVLAGFSVLTACGGGSGSGGTAEVGPTGSPAQTFQSFMKAAADSNLARMAQLWGTDAGSAAETGKPDGWEKRLIVMQAYLRGDSTQIVSNVPVTGNDNQRRVIVALYRPGCIKQIPATMTRGKGGRWLVVEVDVQSAGNPRNPCEGTELMETLTR